MTEIEFKFTLQSKEDYQRFQKEFSSYLKEKKLIINNYYYNEQQKTVLRLRNINQKIFVISVKYGTQSKNGLFKSGEIEEKITEDEYKELLTKEEIYYEVLDQKIPFTFVDTAVTERFIYNIEGMIFELDRVYFQNIDSFYEVEVEISDTHDESEIKNKIEDLLKKHNIKFLPSKKHKFEILLETKKKEKEFLSD